MQIDAFAFGFRPEMRAERSFHAEERSRVLGVYILSHQEIDASSSVGKSKRFIDQGCGMHGIITASGQRPRGIRHWSRRECG